jgi:nicotinate-nucleotide adenylyltransferase
VPASEAGSPLRIGLFGGTFDPPHIGHVTVARDVADALDLDMVLWIPAGVPPHKPGEEVSSAELRLEMAEAAADADRRFRVTDMELRREGPSFTVDTLRATRREHPDADLFLIVGADQLKVLDTGWRAPGEILSMATLVVMDRDGEDAVAVAPRIPGIERLLHVPVTRIDLSSREIRRQVAEGRDPSGAVPAAVAAIVRREGLYRRER